MPKNITSDSSMYDISQYNLMNIRAMNKQICNPTIQPDANQISVYHIPSKERQNTSMLKQYNVVEHFKRGIICDDSKK